MFVVTTQLVDYYSTLFLSHYLMVEQMTNLQVSLSGSH